MSAGMIQASLGSASASCSSRISKPIIRPLLEVIANYDVTALRVSLQGMDLGVKFPTPIADAQLHAAFGQASEQAFPAHNLPSGQQISRLVILKVKWLLKIIEFLLEIS